MDHLGDANPLYALGLLAAVAAAVVVIMYIRRGRQEAVNNAEVAEVWRDIKHP